MRRKVPPILRSLGFTEKNVVQLLQILSPARQPKTLTSQSERKSQRVLPARPSSGKRASMRGLGRSR